MISSRAVSFRRALGPFDATMVVVGGIIGSGIFINPAFVAARLNSFLGILFVWTLGGVVALAGALVYAELGSRFPRAGGQYVYLRDAFHPLVGFLYGWALLVSIESGAIAAVALTFAEYVLRLTGGPGIAARVLAVATILLLSIVNVAGVKPGSRVLNVFVVLKVAALAVLIGAGLVLPASSGWMSSGPETMTGATALGAALIPVLFAYGGWQNANYVAEEVERPERTLPLSLLAGTSLVVAVYVLVNVAYLRGLGVGGLAHSMTPAADAAELWFGPAGRTFVAAAIAVSTFGFLDLAILAPTRVYYALAADGYLPGSMGRLHPRFGTPALAIAVQSAWSIALLATGSYAGLLNTVVFADWIFFGSTAATLFVFRRRGASEGFRTPGYPVVPLVFISVGIWVVSSAVWDDPARSAIGALLLVAGVPVFFFFRRRSAAASVAHTAGTRAGGLGPGV
jgi:APA family basic amino acid/polyamine antiporter